MGFKDYKSIIDSIIKEHGFDIKTNLMEKQELIGYDLDTNTIYFNYVMLHNYLKLNLYKSLNENEVIDIMVCHELGHYLDFKNNIVTSYKAKLFKTEGTDKEYMQFVYDREHEAWENGRKLISEKLLNEYDNFNKEILKVIKEKMSKLK